jgi:hypothetical protein
MYTRLPVDADSERLTVKADFWLTFRHFAVDNQPRGSENLRPDPNGSAPIPVM